MIIGGHVARPHHKGPNCTNRGTKRTGTNVWALTRTQPQTHNLHSRRAPTLRTLKTPSSARMYTQNEQDRAPLSQVPLCEEEAVTAYMRDSHGWSLAKCVDLQTSGRQRLFAELQQFMMEGKTTQVQMKLLHKIGEAITGERAPWICVLDCALQLLLTTTDIGLTILQKQMLGLSAAAVADMDVAARAHQGCKHLKKWTRMRGRKTSSERVMTRRPSRRPLRQSLWTLHHQLTPSGSSSWHCALPTAAGHRSSLGWAGLGEVALCSPSSATEEAREARRAQQKAVHERRRRLVPLVGKMTSSEAQLGTH